MYLNKKSRYILFCILAALVPTILLSVSVVTAGSPSKAITIVGSDNLKINQEISSDFRFLPNGPIHVKSGDVVVLSDTTIEPHTLSLVAPGLLPSTFNEVFACGTSPGDICSAIFAAHEVNLMTSPPTIGFLFVDEGVGSCPPPGSPSCTPPDLNTPFSPTGGDSVIIFPGQTITLKVTAPAGTVLHFFCAIHPWMQGEIVVDG